MTILPLNNYDDPLCDNTLMLNCLADTTNTFDYNNEVRKLASSGEMDRTSDTKKKFGLNTTENKLDTTQMKLEEELQNKEIFTHMIKRLTDELIESKNTVRETNNQLLLPLSHPIAPG